MRMTKEQLIQRFPWTNEVKFLREESADSRLAALINLHSPAHRYYDDIPDEAWEAMDQVGMARILESEILSSNHIFGLFQAIIITLNLPVIIQVRQAGDRSLQEIITSVIETTISLSPIKREELIKLYPWTNHLQIFSFAEKFNRGEWQDINEAGVPELLSENIVDVWIISSLLNSILLISRDLDIVQQVENNEVTFKDIVTNQIKLIAQINTQQRLIRPQEVINWLGLELISRMERELNSLNQMDDLIQLLSSSEVRAKLEARQVWQLLSEEKMNFKELLTLAKQLKDTKEREFPSWIDDNIELKGLADHFTDLQLQKLGELLVPSIMQNTNLKSTFLQNILLITCVNNQQKISSCPNLEYFQQLVLTLQKSFLEAIKKEVVSNVIPEAPSWINHLIRTHVKEYQNPHIPLPSDPYLRKEAIDCAFRAVAETGNFWNLIVLLPHVSNINAQRVATGKTALHGAAQYACKTGDSLCFDLLAAQPGIDLSIKDWQQQTALDLKTPRISVDVDTKRCVM